jgi:RNA polymerase sigma factor (sigma-70 family)
MSMTNECRTRASLLLAAGNPANEKAREAFAVCYGELVRTWCRRSRLQKADEDDLVQTVVFRLLERLPSFKYDPSKRYRGYVSRAVHNAIEDIKRKRQRHPGGHGSGDTGVLGRLHEEPGQDDPAVEDLSNALADQMERGQRLRDACERVRDQVKPRTWQAFELTAVNGQSAADVGQQLEMTPGAVLVARHRVTKKIRSEFEGTAG